MDFFLEKAADFWLTTELETKATLNTTLWSYISLNVSFYVKHLFIVSAGSTKRFARNAFFHNLFTCLSQRYSNKQKDQVGYVVKLNFNTSLLNYVRKQRIKKQ